MEMIIKELMKEDRYEREDDSFIVCGFVDAMIDEYREELCFE
jgi:hypothetical protein